MEEEPPWEHGPLLYWVKKMKKMKKMAEICDYWRKLRKLCTLELLSKKRVRSFQSIREEEALNLINRIASTAAGSPVNLTDKVYTFTCSVTSRAAFGKKCKDQEEFLSAVNETGKLLGGFNIEDLFPSINMLLRWVSGIRSRLEKLHHATDRILENIINEHNNQGKTTTADVGKSNDEENHEDLVDVLLKVQQDGDIKLTIDNIKAVIWVSIFTSCSFYVSNSPLSMQSSG
ncbi:hypothetical protein LWI29_017191 [Acer saccharum]|uniref:Cytochrome P450 n=1 Tax=Acer saccharum TaxID=4024 RepID=A0AA39W308_ACESA|nr:hypothetical protein LWI29_017191 [Acer saccharum]